MQSAPVFQVCQMGWSARRFVYLAEIFAQSPETTDPGTPDPEGEAIRICRAFNTNAASLEAIKTAIRQGDADAADLLAWMKVKGLTWLPAAPLPPGAAAELQHRFDLDPEGFIDARVDPYPLVTETGAWGFEATWVADTLAASRERMAAFVDSRTSDCAVLIGNGPSLRHVDVETLRGQEVFISNYAIRHPQWQSIAKGVAVTNRLVAEQEPFAFQLPQIWKFHPIWLGHTLSDSPKTVWLNALGGPLFFPSNILRRAAWHAIVSYFWLQILLHAGYRRVVMTGFDNSYSQPKNLPEGTLLRQEKTIPTILTRPISGAKSGSRQTPII